MFRLRTFASRLQNRTLRIAASTTTTTAAAAGRPATAVTTTATATATAMTSGSASLHTISTANGSSIVRRVGVSHIRRRYLGTGGGAFPPMPQKALVQDYFGANVFDRRTMKATLEPIVFQSYLESISQGKVCPSLLCVPSTPPISIVPSHSDLI